MRRIVLKELVATEITKTADGRWRLWFNRRDGVKAMVLWVFEEMKISESMPHMRLGQDYMFDGPTVIFYNEGDAIWGLLRWA